MSIQSFGLKIQSVYPNKIKEHRRPHWATFFSNYLYSLKNAYVQGKLEVHIHLGEADICRSGHSLKRTIIEADIRQSRHSSKQTFVKVDIHRSGHSSKQTFVKVDIH